MSNVTSLVDSVLQRLRAGESEDQVLAFLDTLSWNEIRSIKGEQRTQCGDARTWPESSSVAFFSGCFLFFS
jgi:hypothetical protein